jgi:hypothetical protein
MPDDGPFLQEHRSLIHAKLVLFVHHGEPQGLELHGVVNERMRADDDVRGAALDVRERGVPRPLRRAAGQQDDLRGLREPREDLRERPLVLRRENLRRRHERALVPVADGGENRERGDDGFPAPDVALQHPQHRARARHVV